MFGEGGSETIAADTSPCGRPVKDSLWSLRPKCSKVFGQGTAEWFKACDAAFVRAFVESCERWPTEMQFGRKRQRLFMRPR
jgi:hypothetical protein